MRRYELQSKIILTALTDDPVDLPFLLMSTEIYLNERPLYRYNEAGHQVALRFHFDNTTVKEVKQK